MSEFPEEILRTAAVMAVLSMIEEDSDSDQVGRRSGSVWAQDHRLIASGQQSLMRGRSSRSPWR